MDNDSSVSNDPQVSKKLVSDYLRAFVSADYERLTELVSEDFVISWRYNVSGKVGREAARRIEGRDAYLAYARDGLTTVRYSYDDPVIRPVADGSSVYVETMATLLLPFDPQEAPEIEYHNEFVYRFDIRDGQLTQQIGWHNPVAAMVFHTDRDLPTKDEIRALGEPGQWQG
ncbi:nuclear transport factor 2 family protein [Rhodococcus sp. C3V]|uniref:nuclear transport factor 2 family protein n=1 Tax=Rhodococcus sp. C3V TaxID=3034165 RepID=UPI0023E0F506|nr:nuclear transport factor 2 family protein [Rhodococcus sp. C3V]MDF3319980.1 nuclear transport factor 2 family protein [Rhodococcus sp. C3V]